MNPMLARSDPRVAPYEVDPVRSLHQQLRHQRIVIVRARDVAIRARLRFRHAHGMWDISAEGVTTQTFRRNCLLLRINPFSILILRAHEDRARGSRWRDSIACNSPVLTQHVNVVSESLKVVLRVVAKMLLAFIVKHWLLSISRHRQMTSKAACCPR